MNNQILRPFIVSLFLLVSCRADSQDFSSTLTIEAASDVYGQLLCADGGRTGHVADSLGPLTVAADEDHDLEFARWEWYWRQHLDPNGYLVSPLKNWHEWAMLQQSGQLSRTTAGNNSAWTFAGPDTGSTDNYGQGRINVVSFDPVDSNTFWIGSPGGGAWKTTNNGVSWVSMTDNLPSLSVSDITFNPKNRNTLYLCTGDRDAGDYYSIGVLKSTNGGTTWSATGILWTANQLNYANSLVINPSDTNRLLLASSKGIYSSLDGGATWTQVFTGANVKQVLYNPGDTNIVYATTYYSYSGSYSAQVYRSADGGTTWNQATTFTDAMRITLAVTPANPHLVKAVVADYSSTNSGGLQGIFSSSDNGMTFTEIYTGGCSGHQNLLSSDPTGAGCGGQGWYDLALAISPLDSNKLFLGGVSSFNSSDGGHTWSLMTEAYSPPGGYTQIHADKHCMRFAPLRPNRFFECNDGGIVWSDYPSSSSTWNNISGGLDITEFYRVAVSNIGGYALAGAQDNGTKLVEGPFSTNVGGGDGMECHIDPIDTNAGYVASQYGDIWYYYYGGANHISTNIPGAPTGAWITPYVIEPSCPGCLLAGYNQVYASIDYGSTWNSISGNLGGGTLYRIATALSDPNTIYATQSYSQTIYYTNNFGATWNELPHPTGGSPYISDIVVDQVDATKVWITFSGYGSPKVMSYSPAAGWAYFNTALPDVPVNCITIDTSNQVFYIGTDIGVFYRTHAMSQWAPYQSGLPVVRANDLQINYGTGTIWAATYGRGLWSTPKQIYTDTAAGVPVVHTSTFSVFPNPGNGAFTVMQAGNTNPIIELKLVDEMGRTVWQQNNLNGNSGPIHASATGVAPGVYTLMAAHQDQTADRQKMVIY